MQHMDRQKLVLLIGAGFFLLLAVVVIVVSVLTSSGETDPNPTPTPKPSVSEPANNGEDYDGEEVVGNPDEEGAPPENMYSNDYSQDEGYEPLPEGFDPDVNAKEGTIFEDKFVYFTFNRLMCELSNKQVVTSKALASIEAFLSDLNYSGTETATATRAEATKQLKWFTARMGERVGLGKQEEISVMYCNRTELDIPEGHEH